MNRIPAKFVKPGELKSKLKNIIKNQFAVAGSFRIHLIG